MLNLEFPPIDTLPTAVLSYIRGIHRAESRHGQAMGVVSLSSWSVMQRPWDGYALTHLQKYSPFGFLLTWPFCFHVWFQFRKQEGSEGRWEPGTERVFYARTPGYRMDIDYGMKWTWGYIGLHWD